MTLRSRAYLFVALLACLAARPAFAQQYVLGGNASLSSGIAGGGAGKLLLERARTRLTLGVDLRVDEFPKDVFLIAAVAELEPHASFGLDVSYRRRMTPKIDLEVGGVGFIFPESLIGPEFGASYRLPLSRSLDLMLGPEVDIFVIGSDLPSGSVVWNVLLKAGIHVDL